MKKFLVLFLTIAIALTLSACTVFEEVFNPIKLHDTKKCQESTIKTSVSTYVITPVGFDLEELNKRGYKMSIEVTYDVYYTKDWNSFFDIGYLGAPKYEVSILNDDLVGNMDYNVVAPSKSEKRTITYITDAVNLSGSKINTVFYQCRAFCDSFYNSDIFPVSK